MTKEEAIERIKSRYDKWALDDKDLEAIQCTFPELRESEDERIRKAIWLVLVATEEDQDAFYRTHNLTRKECTDWLEKQKEVKADIIEASAHLGESQTISGETPVECGEADEDIRKFLIDMISHCDSVHWARHYRIGQRDAISWLEKQKEAKPAEWSEEDELMRKRCIADLGCLTECEPEYKERYDAQIKWLKSLSERFNLQPIQERGEEDEEIIKEITCVLHSAAMFDKDRVRLENWLWSFRPQSHWKPSEEQMEYLAKAIETLGYEGYCKTAMYLSEIRKELKKL